MNNLREVTKTVEALSSKSYQKNRGLFQDLFRPEKFHYIRKNVPLIRDIITRDIIVPCMWREG